MEITLNTGAAHTCQRQRYIEDTQTSQTQLQGNKEAVQKMIQNRQKKVDEINASVKLSRHNAEIEMADSLEVFTALIQSMESSQAELIETIEKKQKTAETRAEVVINELLLEMNVLKNKMSELEKLSQTQDNLLFLQSFSETSNLPKKLKDLNKVRVSQVDFLGACEVVRVEGRKEAVVSKGQNLFYIEHYTPVCCGEKTTPVPRGLYRGTKYQENSASMLSMTSPNKGRTLSEDSFQCSICLEVFVEPVSTPCGHSFCKACLQGYWDHCKKFICPMCKKSYSRRPELSINRVLAEISAQFQELDVKVTPPNTKRGAAGTLPSGQGVQLEPQTHQIEGGEFARTGEVPCDACIGRKMRALKSCLSCPGSFCEAHLRHHKKVKSLMSHRLIEPVHQLEEKICRKHERLLEVYCRTDHSCICISCAESTHKSHKFVSIDQEWKKKTNYLGRRKSELRQLIKERTKKLDEIKHSIRVIKSSAQKELEDSWQVYADLQRLVEQSQAELVELISTRQREAERHAQELARGVENELSQLRKRSAEMDEVGKNQDKVIFLQQTLPTLGSLPEPIDWSGVSVNTDLYLGTVQSSVSMLIDRFQDELKRLCGKELRKLQNYASEVFLDSGTAQKNLVLSEDSRQVIYEERKHNQSEGPRRFNPALFVLAREGLSSGRHYWEVDVACKTAWTLGVARGSARRKGEINLSPDGGFWCLWLKSGEVKALESSRVPLHLTSVPKKIGIFLDHEGGQVSFYDVKARTHLFTFTDTFDETLYPIFSPCLNQEGKNAAPLIISAVKHN
ncbi:hypothetical protein DPEC_G00096070 [Dallia pectoralis]|uniref:Uncharacterized protein n=1 Tax=Dallia pectoralis TaxID=75939 RepID=A0ACC2GVQ8_DALPE|nr:hypothetical protein DPEC_G00096070 [Dallia pectoralis]